MSTEPEVRTWIEEFDVERMVDYRVVLLALNRHRGAWLLDDFHWETRFDDNWQSYFHVELRWVPLSRYALCPVRIPADVCERLELLYASSHNLVRRVEY